MQLIAWMYDIAREQSPREDWLVDVLERSLAAGYNAVGFYLEHRFAYRSAPWAAAPGCLTRELIARLRSRYPAAELRIMPFLNTLGHMEGFIRSEGGQHLAEGPRGRMLNLQICPSSPDAAAFARGLVGDALEAFDDPWVHLGGDEASQLGQCPACAEREKSIGKAGLYAEWYAPLCRWVLAQGRRPCLWGDMLLSHAEALDALPRETVIFDWQYDHGPQESTKLLRERGFDVVCCPSLHTYDAGWCFLKASQQNIDEHAAAATALAALGVCVTTWEFSHFSEYESVLPLLYAAGRRLARNEAWPAAIAAEGGEAYARAAEVLGNEVPAAAAFIRSGTWRQLRDRLVMRQNPFLLWRDWRAEVCGPAGDEILRLCDRADHLRTAAGGIVRPRATPGYTNNPLAFATELHRVAVLWVWGVEAAYKRYAAGDFEGCARELRSTIPLLERLRPGLRRAAEAGGAAADLARLDRLREKCEMVIERVRGLPADSAQRPAFQTLVQDGWMPGDQAAWGTDR